MLEERTHSQKAYETGMLQYKSSFSNKISFHTENGYCEISRRIIEHCQHTMGIRDSYCKRSQTQGHAPGMEANLVLHTPLIIACYQAQ